jgi:hypothetical protein
MTDIPRQACWEAQDARAMLSTEALEGDAKLFLSTHVPVEDFHVGGSLASDVVPSTERGLLDALAKPGMRHAFCVVEGEPGSGKSHLIRWLRVKWPAQKDLVLLIQRLDGSLQGTLRQLERALPNEFKHLFERLGRAQDLTTVGRARVFHTNLAHALEPNHFTTPLPDAEWCDKFRLADLLGDRAVLDAWKAPERIMELLSGKKGQRDQELARFNLDDIADLELIVRPLKAQSIKAARFARELQKETEGLRQVPAEQKRNPAFQDELRTRFPNSSQFVDALNTRRNHAVQTVLGISSEGLKELFIQLRRGLGNRRLVLLLEDITSWEGVDNQLIDVLVTNVETRSEADLCPMISVVGITPHYFSEKGFQANYRQRITHHVRLGEEHGGSQYQDVASLRTPEDQVTFAATYLRAIRAGVERLKEWESDQDPVPNRCDTCAYRPTCHEVFGHESGVGLFPFNRRAITKLFGSLTDPQHQATHQTPRGMIQGVLTPSLTRSREEINDGRYPDRQVTALEWLPEEKRHLRGMPAEILRAHSDEEHRDRLERIVLLWGNGESLVQLTTQGHDDRLYFGDVARDIYEAFRYPWPGSESPTPQTPASRPDPKDQSTPKEQPSSGGGAGQAKPRTSDPTKKQSGPLPPSELEPLFKALDRWMAEKPVEQEAKLNHAVFDIADRLNYSQLEISPWVKKRLFTRENFILDGTRKDRTQSFVIPRVEWVRSGLEAYFNLRTSTDAPAVAIERYQHQYATFVRRLKRALRDRVSARMPRLQSKARWQAQRAATQVLLARSWLRGTVSPVGDLSEQWKGILQDEAEATSGPQDRVDSWQEVVEKTRGRHGVIRAMLGELINLPMESTGSMLLVDPAACAHASTALCKTLKFDDAPDEIPEAGKQLAELVALIETADEIDQRLARLPKYELERLKSAAKFFEETILDTSVPEYLERAARIIQRTEELLPTAAPVLVRNWANAFLDLKNKEFLSRDSDAPSMQVQRFMDAILELDQEALVRDPAKALDWVVRAPASNLRVLVEALKHCNTAIKGLTNFAEEYIHSAPGEGGGLKKVHDLGAEISKTAEAMAKELA